MNVEELKTKAKEKWDGVKVTVSQNKKYLFDAGIALVGLASAIITFAGKAKENSEWVEVKYHLKKETADELAKTISLPENED